MQTSRSDDCQYECGKHEPASDDKTLWEGYFNGSHPHFGFKAPETAALGNKGQKKTRLAVDPAEAAIVRKIYDLYLGGSDCIAVR